MGYGDAVSAVVNAVEGAAAGSSSNTAPFALSIDGAPDLEVTDLEGVERISELYRFEVRFVTDAAPGSFEPAAFGKMATITLNGPAASRTIRGLVVGIRYEGVRASDRHSIYRAEIAPKAWLLGRRTSSRIFQGLRANEIVSTILDGWSIAHKWNLTRDLPVREYCVQYRETDLAFVTRILAEEGVFFLFDAPASLDDPQADATILFVDASSGYLPIVDVSGPLDPTASGPTIAFGDHHDGRADETITKIETAREILPTSLVRMAYDWTRPILDTTERSPALDAATLVGPQTPTPLEVYEHEPEFGDAIHGADVGAELEAHRRRAFVAKGASTCRRLAAGRRFTLGSHAEESLDREWVIVEVRHRGEVPERDHEGHQEAKRVETYDNTFECVPADVAYRPERARLDLRNVVEVATVVGAGDDVYTDEFGRIKVRFPWDREATDSPTSSCWIRVAQAWAGASWGFQFVPRIGMEVLVTFLAGDVDRPIVIGCLGNGSHPPPFALPRDAARSGIRTQSFGKTGGYNELSFGDAQDNESVLLRAQRDHERDVLHDERVRIGNDLRVQVGATYEENARARRAIIETDDALSLGGNRRLIVNGDEAIRVAGNRQDIVSGRHQRFAQEDTCVVSNDARVQVGGSYLVSVGNEAKKTDASWIVQGDARHYATGRATIVAEDQLVLQCGTTTLTLKKDALEIEADAITIKAKKSVSMSGKGPSLKLDDAAEVTADNIKLTTKGGSVDLDAGKAKVFGPDVQISAVTDPPDRKDESAKPETQHFKYRLLDPDMQPYASKTYALVTQGFKVKGTTDANGYVEQDVPKDAVTASITLWTDDYPTGPRALFTVRFEDVGPANQPRGAAARLRNLGYYDGPDVDTITPELASALMWFQADSEIACTGLLDGDTVDKLKAAHPEG